MAIDRCDLDERQARLEAMMAEFRAAQQRRLVKAGVDLWKRTEQGRIGALAPIGLPPTLN